MGNEIIVGSFVGHGFGYGISASLIPLPLKSSERGDTDKQVTQVLTQNVINLFRRIHIELVSRVSTMDGSSGLLARQYGGTSKFQNKVNPAMFKARKNHPTAVY